MGQVDTEIPDEYLRRIIEENSAQEAIDSGDIKELPFKAVAELSDAAAFVEKHGGEDTYHDRPQERETYVRLKRQLVGIRGHIEQIGKDISELSGSEKNNSTDRLKSGQPSQRSVR